jgi:hypothetical protein
MLLAFSKFPPYSLVYVVAFSDTKILQNSNYHAKQCVKLRATSDCLESFVRVRGSFSLMQR